MDDVEQVKKLLQLSNEELLLQLGDDISDSKIALKFRTPEFSDYKKLNKATRLSKVSEFMRDHRESLRDKICSNPVITKHFKDEEDTDQIPRDVIIAIIESVLSLGFPYISTTAYILRYSIPKLCKIKWED